MRWIQQLEICTKLLLQIYQHIHFVAFVSVYWGEISHSFLNQIDRILFHLYQYISQFAAFDQTVNAGEIR